MMLIYTVKVGETKHDLYKQVDFIWRYFLYNESLPDGLYGGLIHRFQCIHYYKPDTLKFTYFWIFVYFHYKQIRL
jgi:hypothetical protein